MQVAGKYRLKSLLAEGSHAMIYLAEHLHLREERERVIQVIKPEYTQKQESRIRFEREIQITIALAKRNEHIVYIYDDFGEDPHLGYYYVMEYLSGNTLQSLMYEGEAIEQGLAFHIFYQLSKALGAAHRAGIVHRDLKPENIILLRRDMDEHFVKVIDFGIAKPLKRKSQLHLTQGALGTPQYMSPEQCINQNIDHRSDIYALGVLMYELLTGYLPFENEEGDLTSRSGMLSLLDAHLHQQPMSMRERSDDAKSYIDIELDRMVLRALAKDPDERYQSMEQFWRAIAPFAPPTYYQLLFASHGIFATFTPSSLFSIPAEAQVRNCDLTPAKQIAEGNFIECIDSSDVMPEAAEVSAIHEAISDSSEELGSSIDSISTLAEVSAVRATIAESPRQLRYSEDMIYKSEAASSDLAMVAPPENLRYRETTAPISNDNAQPNQQDAPIFERFDGTTLQERKSKMSVVCVNLSEWGNTESQRQSAHTKRSQQIATPLPKSSSPDHRQEHSEHNTSAPAWWYAPIDIENKPDRK
jgi:serine/threonine protein kinase